MKESYKATGYKRFGEWAVNLNLISDQQLKEALLVQKEMEEQGLGEKLGAILGKKCRLTEQDVQRVLQTQKDNQRRLGNYEVYEKIGQGAMGVVFRARQISLDRVVALKLLSPKLSEDKIFIERFIKEARSAGRFSHENIVSALDVGQSGAYHFFAMEYVDGESLGALIKRRGSLAETESLEYVRQIARGLEHALMQKIIHRDVKPDNVMIAKHRNTAKLLDLGLACAASTEGDKGDEARRLDTAGKAVGTPHYMAPEAAQGEANLDTRADIYSLGCLFYHLLVGQPPYGDCKRTSQEVMTCQVSEPFPDLQRYCKDVSTNTCAIIQKMTEKNRDDRYEHPAALLDDLDAILDGAQLVHAVEQGRSRTGRSAGGTTKRYAPTRGKGTTGPCKPVEPRGTTGPRAAVRPRDTTGPAAPVSGPFIDQQTLSTNRRQKKNPVVAWAGVAVAVVVVGGFSYSFMKNANDAGLTRKKKGTIEAVEQANKAEKAEKVENQTIAGEEGSANPPIKTIVKGTGTGTGTAEALAPSRQEKASRAWKTFEDARKAEPHDFSTLALAIKNAQIDVAQTSYAEKLNEASAALQTQWLDVFEERLKGVDENAKALILKGEAGAYVEALALFDEQHIPAPLQVFDWRVRVEAKRKQICLAADAFVATLLKTAREKAGHKKIADMEAAIALVQQAEQVPVSMAPALKGAAQERAQWERDLMEAKALAAQEEGAQKANAQKLFAEARTEVAALLKKNDIKKAILLLEEKLHDSKFKSAREELEREKHVLILVQALRDRAMALLRGRLGETVELGAGSTKIKGQIAKSLEQDAVTVKMGQGAMISIRTEQLSTEDVDSAVPLAQGDGEAEDLFNRGLLYWISEDYVKATVYFHRAETAGLRDQVQPYLERLITARTEASETMAQNDWNRAEALIAAKQWRQALPLFEAFSKKHQTTQFHKEHADQVQIRINLINEILNPITEGLVGSYFVGPAYDASMLKLKRTDAQINFDWDTNSPAEGMPADNFYVRWDGFLKIEKAGVYTFTTNADDGARLWVDQKSIIDKWFYNPKTRNSESCNLTTGNHQIRLEFNEGVGHAKIQLLWALEGGFEEQVIPSNKLFHKSPK